MNCRKPILAIAAGMFAVIGWVTPAADAGPRRLYEVTTATSMPHLDESLRYATRTQARCIDIRDLSDEFWMLREVSLQDCRLLKVSESAEAAGATCWCVTAGTAPPAAPRGNWGQAPSPARSTCDSAART
jgi:hypothetical protein